MESLSSKTEYIPFGNKIRVSLEKLKASAVKLGNHLIKIDDDRETLLKEISSLYSIEDPLPVYERVYNEISEGVIESINSDEFFIESEKGIIADKQQSFLYNIWMGDYYGDSRHHEAFLKFAEELEERTRIDFVQECKTYSL